MHLQIENRLANTIKSGHISTSWILNGQFGVGKETIAKKFTTFVLSETTPETSQLDIESLPEVSNTWKMINSKTHPDFFEIDCSLSSETPMVICRDVISRLYSKPVLGKWKALLIHEGENLSKNVVNLLLKLFEEPPANTILIITTTNIDILPITLRSRCVCIQVPSFSEKEMIDILNKQEEHSDELIALSNGSIGLYQILKANNASDLYKQFLEITSLKIQDASFTDKLSKFEMSLPKESAWRFIKKMILRLLTIVINNDLGTIFNYTDAETEFLKNNRIAINGIISEILDMISITETSNLDNRVFLLWFLQKLTNNKPITSY